MGIASVEIVRTWAIAANPDLASISNIEFCTSPILDCYNCCTVKSAIARICILQSSKNYYILDRFDQELRRKKAMPRFELGIKALQAPALPLGYIAGNN
jgi:hypothetical protein